MPVVRQDTAPSQACDTADLAGLQNLSKECVTKKMPYTLNGCGTRYCGNRDIAEDGSYVTTLWITVFWMPIIPLRSYRVKPVGEGTHWVIHNSQNYLAMRVPLCWKQVRNTYLLASPILLLVAYFSWPDLRQWTYDARPKIAQAASPSGEMGFKPRSSSRQTKESPTTENDKWAAANVPTTGSSCGQVIELDKSGFERLDLPNQLSKLVDNGNFTYDDLQKMPITDLRDSAFQAYALAYLTWNKSTSHGDFDKMIEKARATVPTEKLTGTEQDDFTNFMQKYKSMMLNAFDLGRYDANRDPCPF
jgi:hypothetical protein